MKTTHPVLASFALLVGFLLLLSKVPVLLVPAILLILAGLFAPFYEDQLERIFHRTTTIPTDAGNTIHTEGGFSPSVKNVSSSGVLGQHTRTVEIAAKGRNRALIATVSAISELQLLISKGSSSVRGQDVETPKPTSVKLGFSGDKLTKQEIDLAKELVRSEFPGITVDDVSDLDILATAVHGSDAGEFKIWLEASSIES